MDPVAVSRVLAAWSRLILGVAFTLVGSDGVAQEAAHVHGAVRLDVTTEAQALVVEMEAPLDSLLGFERAPRTAAEKKAAEAMLARMQKADTLIVPEAAAGCSYKTGSARSEVLKTGAKAAGEHADLDGRFEWQCSHLAMLRSLDLSGLLTAFPRIRTIEVQVASEAGQFKQVVTRSQKVVRWGR